MTDDEDTARGTEGAASPSGTRGGAVHRAPGEGTELLTSVGSPILVKASGEDTDGRYALFEWDIEKDAGPQLHTHPHEDEAFYVLSGTVSVTVDTTTFTAGQGSYVLMPKGVPHRFVALSDVRMLTLMSPAGFEEFLEARSDHLRRAGTLEREVVERLVAEHRQRMATRGVTS